jgi:hypothetical protein
MMLRWRIDSASRVPAHVEHDTSHAHASEDSKTHAPAHAAPSAPDVDDDDVAGECALCAYAT